jgi:hypothetical protein
MRYAEATQYKPTNSRSQNRSTEFLAFSRFSDKAVCHNSQTFFYKTKPVTEGIQLSSKIIFKGLTKNLSMSTTVLRTLMLIKFAYCISMFCYKCFIFFSVFESDHMKEDEIGKVCSTNGKDVKYGQ